MKRTRIFRICLAGFVLLLGLTLFLGKDMYAAIWNAYEDRDHVSVRVNDSNVPDVLCSHTVETGEVAVYLEVLDVTKDIEGLNHRYRLNVECQNRGETQYRYRIKLNGYSDSLITDGDDAEFTSGSNYRFANLSGGMEVEFVPAEKQGSEGTAGTAEYQIWRNLPAPTIGTISVTITTYLPYFDLQIHSLTQELIFPITEP